MFYYLIVEGNLMAMTLSNRYIFQFDAEFPAKVHFHLNDSIYKIIFLSASYQVVRSADLNPRLYYDNAYHGIIDL